MIFFCSGRHAVKKQLEQLGYELDDVQLETVFWRFKGVAEQKKRVTDADLRALVLDEIVAKAKCLSFDVLDFLNYSCHC
ncbi:hypothetical protein M0R45_005286 [Rubus argutus]|uniref:2-isopropylmalate synthase/homocitrate synthase post-catalytic domain-containing protein n=1 Tax=Rubus argutus TaxID=59490 RepID=A0AAW1YM90_RUBAR